MKKFKFFIVFFIFLFFAEVALAYQPVVAYLQNGNIKILNPEISRAFFDELKNKPRDYIIDSFKDFDLSVNLSVPATANPDGRFVVNIYSVVSEKDNLIFSSDSVSPDWAQYYDSFGRDYYLQGPKFEKNLSAGEYKIEISSQDNTGKYVLFVGKTEKYTAMSIINSFWQLPLLKLMFFRTSVLQFLFTYFGIGAVAFVGFLLFLVALVNYLIGVAREIIKHNQAKTILLTSAGMVMKDEITKLLQKPAYDVNVSFITTAAKQVEDVSFVKQDFDVMKDMGFNIEELDIEGKTPEQLMEILKVKDIVFVEGGNTFYLLNAMQRCGFEKVIKELLKSGIVYIGASAGSIVAGKTIQTANWLGDENIGDFKDLRGLNLVPFDVFVHYEPKYAEILKQKKNLRILTDNQAILVQGKEIDLIGKGEEIIL